MLGWQLAPGWAEVGTSALLFLSALLLACRLWLWGYMV